MLNMKNIKFAVVTSNASTQKKIFNILNNNLLNFNNITIEQVIKNNYNFLLFDCDNPTNYFAERMLENCDLPKIALFSKEDLRQVSWAISKGFHSSFHTDSCKASFISTSIFAYSLWERENSLKLKNEELANKLELRKFIILAELEIIKWYQCSENDAYLLLRNIAMVEQITIEELCIRILSSPNEWRFNLKRKFLSKIL